MSEHSILAPSSSHCWLVGRCYGSVAAAAAHKGEDTSSIYADEGTAAHAVLEWCLTYGIDAAKFPHPEAFVLNDGGVDWAGDKSNVRNSFIVDDDMRGHVQTVIDQIHSHLPGGSEVAPERRVNYGDPLGLPGGVAFGTADATGRDFENATLHVHDLKYGASPGGIVYAGTPEEPNPQLSLYAIGVLAEEELLGNWQHIALHVHQPRLDHWDSVTLTVDELHSFGLKASEAAEKALSGFYEEDGELLPLSMEELDDLGLLNPSATNCKYCPAAAICPSAKRQHKAVVVEWFDDLVDSDTTGEEVAEAIDAELPAPETLALLKRFITAVEERASDQLHAGKKVPGWKLVRGRGGPRKWDDEAKVEKILSKSMRVKKEDMYAMKLVSPAQAEKLFKESPARWSRLEKYVAQASGKETPVSVSDKREAIVHEDVTDQFEMETE